jgi:hypothetical protein
MAVSARMADVTAAAGADIAIGEEPEKTALDKDAKARRERVRVALDARRPIHIV